jgi:hypothetical protein
MSVSIFYRAFKFQYPAFVNNIAVRSCAYQHCPAFLRKDINGAVFIAVFTFVIELRRIGSAVVIVYPYCLRIYAKSFRHINKLPLRVTELRE